MNESIRLLLVEDNEDDAALIVAELRRRGHQPNALRVDTLASLEAAFRAGTWDCVLSDFSLPTCNGLDVLRAVRERDPDVPFLFVSGSIGEEVAVSAMRAGAHDYILKDNLTRLEPAIARELKDAVERREHRETAWALHQAQKMELVARLAGGVAHDFNNLLAVVILSADLAREDASPKTHALLDDITQAAVDGAALTRQLLALGRRQALVPNRLDINGLVRGQESLMRRLGGERVSLRLDLAPDPGTVNVDPTQLEQVLLNLCVNARDAMPDGGQLTIQTARVDLEEPAYAIHGVIPPGAYTMIAVADTGVGMDRATLTRIFEPFFSTKAVGKGTGLGLAVVHGILTQSQGHVAVFSESGMGTTFRVYLPRLSGDFTPAVVASVSIAPRARDGEFVLIAEDEATLRRAAVQALQRCGYSVLSAADANEALSLAKRHQGRIHLLVSDVVMPGLSGPQLYEELRRDRRDLRVLFTSGYLPDHVSRQNARTLEGRFLLKPFTMGDLARKVREAIDTTPAGVRGS